MAKILRSDIDTTAKILRKETKSDIDMTAKNLRAYIDTTANTLRKEVKSDMSAMEYRILEQMALMFEHHRHEIIGATKDATESLNTRVTRLERHAGFATAA